MLNTSERQYQDHWEDIEIDFDRVCPPVDQSGVGGTFNQRNYPLIIVTHIHEHSLADRDKQLKLHDIILRVDDQDLTNIKHEEAVEILKSSGQIVKLIVRRLSPNLSEEIELKQSGKLGISIAGGIGNGCFEDDHGIFVTKINIADANKRLALGDRLLEISSKSNTYDLRFVTFETAKEHIQLACAESETIKLTVAHTKPVEQVQNETEENGDPLDSEDEVSVHMKSEAPLIMSFDLDDYQRYEKRLSNRNSNGAKDFLLKRGEEQPTTTNSVTVTDRITIIERVDVRKVNANAVAIPQSKTNPRENTHGVILGASRSPRWQVD